MLDRKKEKAEARKMLSGKMKTAVLAQLVSTLVVVLLYIVPYTINILNGSNLGLMWLVTLVLAIVMLLILPAFQMAFVVLIKNIKYSDEPQTLGKYFSYLKFWKQGLGCFWYQYLFLVLWMLLAMIPLIIFACFFVYTGSAVFGFLMFLSYIFLLCIAINRGIAYSLSWYSLADESSKKASEAVKLSKKLTKHHIWSLFVFELSFIGWYLLCILTLGIGYLWLSPYMVMSYLNAYDDLKSEPEKIEETAKTE